MRKTATEIKLLKLLQNYQDALDFLSQQVIIPMDQYKSIMVKYLVCKELLTEYRRGLTYGRLKLIK